MFSKRIFGNNPLKITNENPFLLNVSRVFPDTNPSQYIFHPFSQNIIPENYSRG